MGAVVITRFCNGPPIRCRLTFIFISSHQAQTVANKTNLGQNTFQMLLYNIYGFCQPVKLRRTPSSNSVSHQHGKHVKQCSSQRLHDCVELTQYINHNWMYCSFISISTVGLNIRVALSGIYMLKCILENGKTGGTHN